MFFFRIDLSKKNGLGHYLRVKSFIHHLKIKEYKIIVDKLIKSPFLENEKKNIQFLYKRNHKFINETQDAKNFLRLTKCNSKVDFVIKDSYRLNYIWEKTISNYCKKIIIIDDFPNEKHYADYYVNHNPAFDCNNNNYLNNLRLKNKKNCKFLLGKNFALFNTNYEKKIKITSDFVFYNGGSGSPLVYEKIIIKISKEINKFNIILIIGPLVKDKTYKEAVRKFKKFKNVKIVYHPKNILNFLNGTKLFISSAGISMFESSYLRIPTLLFKMVKNQSLNDHDYEKLGHYFVLEKKDLKYSGKIVTLLKLMINNRTQIIDLMREKVPNTKKISNNYKHNLKF